MSSTSRCRTPAFLLVSLALTTACVGAAQDPDSDEAIESASVDSELVAGAGPCGPALAAVGVTANGAQAGNPASNAIDGQLTTRWSRDGVGSYITLDLGGSRSLCGLGVAWYSGASRSNNFTIALSTNGVDFVQARTGTSSGQTTEVEGYLASGTARYVRLTVNGNTANTWASVTELKAYGVAQPPPPGSYKPSATTTGVPAGTTLTPFNTSGADLVITTDGKVLDKLDIYGDIKVRAKNVVIKNSRLHGGKAIPRSNTGVVDSNSPLVQNLLVQDCTIKPDAPSYYRDGIVGHDYTSRRNHISGSNDGLGIFNVPGGSPNANAKAEANFIHTLTFWSNDPAHTDGTHNDCIQVQGGENIHIIGNTIACDQVIGSGSGPSTRGNHASQGILLQQNVAKLANVVVEKNWIDDGTTSLLVSETPTKGYTNVTVTVQSNKFGRNQYDFGNRSTYQIRIMDRSASVVYGLFTNSWEDTGALLQEGRDLGIRYNTP